MNRAQIDNIARLRDSFQKASNVAERKRRQYREALAKCDHFFANGRSAMKRVSTHSDRNCGGYKECAVCAGELQETFVDACRICKKTGTPYVVQPPLAKPIRL